MNQALSSCAAFIAQALLQCTAIPATTALPAIAADVMPIWQNDTAANTISFSDTFGHQVIIGTYDPGTGIWSIPGFGALLANQIVLGGGVGGSPSTPVGLGTVTQVLHGNVAGAPSFGAISSADVAAVLASPPCIGCTVPGAGAFTSLSSNTIFSNSGGAGYITTAIDNSADNTNGISIIGASTTKAQEITQSPVQISWHPGFTGSPGGSFNTAGLTVTTTSTVNDQIYPWGIIGIVKNFTDVNTTGNPNAVAINGTVFTQNVASSQASSSWGGNFVCNETSATAVANPTHFCLGAEIDVQEPTGSGTDNNSKRIGIYVTAGPLGADLTSHAFAGIDIATNGTLDNGITFFPQSATGNITTLINAGLATGHYTNLIASSNYAVDNTGSTTGLNFTVQGAINFAHLLGSAASPTISSGFCSSPSIQNSNGTFSFQVKIGTGCAGSVGVIGLPSAAAGWHCQADDESVPASFIVSQTTYSQTTAQLTNFSRTTGTATNFGSADVINVSCTAF